MKFGKIELKNSTASKVVETDANNVLIGTRNISEDITTALSADLVIASAITDYVDNYLETLLVTNDVFHVLDEKPQGTVSQVLTAGVDDDRDLTTVRINEIEGASLSGNKILIVPSGTYEIEAWSRIQAHQFAPAAQTVLSLYDNTNNVVLEHQTNYYNLNFTEPIYDAVQQLKGKFILSGTTNITLRQNPATNCNGGHVLNKTGYTEIYSGVFIKRTARAGTA